MALKTKKFRKKIRQFLRKKIEKYFELFSKFSAKILRFWSKNGWFYKILEKSAQTENLGRSRP